MVFFSCNACGESLKKASVEKHYLTNCRACEVLSCLDCGKDFYGDAYRDHNSCISEDQKYGGKNYKPVVQKGQVKQTGWIETVREASMSPSLNPKVKNVLDRIISGGHENIPRKKAKFANFLGSSLRLWDQKLIDQVWNVISTHASTQKPNNPQQSSIQRVYNQESESTQPVENKVTNEFEQNEDEQRDKEETKKKKKKHKEKSGDNVDEKDEEEALGGRKRKRQGDPLEAGEVEKEIEEEVKKKKKKKKRREETNGVLESINESAVESSSFPDRIDGQKLDQSNSQMSSESVNGNSHKEKKRKKRKKEKVNGEDVNGLDAVEEEDLGPNDEGPEVEEPRKAHSGEKFPWSTVIAEVLEKAGVEIPLKKLRKKVLSEFHSRGGDPSITSEEKLFAKFNKKVTKNPKLKIHKDMVKLKH